MFNLGFFNGKLHCGSSTFDVEETHLVDADRTTLVYYSNGKIHVKRLSNHSKQYYSWGYVVDADTNIDSTEWECDEPTDIYLDYWHCLYLFLFYDSRCIVMSLQSGEVVYTADNLPFTHDFCMYNCESVLCGGQIYSFVDHTWKKTDILCITADYRIHKNGYVIDDEELVKLSNNLYVTDIKDWRKSIFVFMNERYYLLKVKNMRKAFKLIQLDIKGEFDPEVCLRVRNNKAYCATEYSIPRKPILHQTKSARNI